MRFFVIKCDDLTDFSMQKSSFKVLCFVIRITFMSIGSDLPPVRIGSGGNSSLTVSGDLVGFCE